MQGRDDITAFIESFTGSHRLVLDYLIEEFLSQQTESVQTFLLQTSILDRLTGSLCNALTGGDDGQQVKVVDPASPGFGCYPSYALYDLWLDMVNHWSSR